MKDIKEIIKKELLFEAGGELNPLSNPIKSPSVKMASGETELKAAGCFIIDKIKNNFRDLGIYVEDDYTESFVTLEMLRKRTTPFNLSFSIKNNQFNGAQSFKGKATFNKNISNAQKTVVLDFEGKNNNNEDVNFRMLFSNGKWGSKKNSINRNFFTRKKTLQKLRSRTDNTIVGLQKGGVFDVKIMPISKSPNLGSNPTTTGGIKFSIGQEIKDSKGNSFTIKGFSVKGRSYTINNYKKPSIPPNADYLNLEKSGQPGKIVKIPYDKAVKFFNENINRVQNLINEIVTVILEQTPSQNLKQKYPTYTIVLKTIGINTEVCSAGDDEDEKGGKGGFSIPKTKDDDDKLSVTGKFEPDNTFEGNPDSSYQNTLKTMANELKSNITGDGMLLAATRDGKGITLNLTNVKEGSKGFVHIKPVNPRLNGSDIRSYQNQDVWIQPNAFGSGSDKAIKGKIDLKVIY